MPANSILGTTRNDVLYATDFADLIKGNGGIDKVSYLRATGSVTASLLTGMGETGFAMGDSYVGIRNLQGSAFDDYLAGDALNNLLQGGDGRDRLVGWDGNDTLNGGNGNDTFVGGAGADVLSGGLGDRDAADYSRAKASIALALDAGGWQGEADGDVFLDVEYVYGSRYDDVIGGNDEVNRLLGNAGNDEIDGGGGNDYILGGTGADTVTGGTGNDVFVIEAGFGADTITDFEAGAGRTDRIWLQGTGLSSFADVLAHAQDMGGTTVITVDGHGTLVLSGVGLAQLAADDFIF